MFVFLLVRVRGWVMITINFKNLSGLPHMTFISQFCHESNMNMWGSARPLSQRNVGSRKLCALQLRWDMCLLLEVWGLKGPMWTCKCFGLEGHVPFSLIDRGPWLVAWLHLIIRAEKLGQSLYLPWAVIFLLYFATFKIPVQFHATYHEQSRCGLLYFI